MTGQHGIRVQARQRADPAHLRVCLHVEQAGASLVRLGVETADKVLLGMTGDLSGCACLDIVLRDAPPVTLTQRGSR